jgi:N-acetylglucosamine-6-phosphate deacetylase
MLLIENARIITEDVLIDKGWLQVEAGKIVAFGSGRASTTPDSTIDAQGMTLVPGFIDVHVHAAVGVDTMDGRVEALSAMAQFFATQGTTAFLATTLTAPHDSILAALDAVGRAMMEKSDGARILGVHLEGPYLNVEKCGAQNPDYVRLCKPDEAKQYFESGLLRIVSLAPEFVENGWLIDICVEQGIVASIAHSNATYEGALQAIERGIRHATHTFNAMRALHHREPGIVGAVMSDERVYCELIADNIHVHPVVMDLLWRAKGRDKLILISDAMRATGIGDGHYVLGELAVTVKEGKATLANGSLAGSVLTMQQAVRNFMAATNTSLEEIWQVFSLNAAKAIGVAGQTGGIAIGKDADLLLLDDAIEVQMTMVCGEVVFRR